MLSTQTTGSGAKIVPVWFHVSCPEALKRNFFDEIDRNLGIGTCLLLIFDTLRRGFLSFFARKGKTGFSVKGMNQADIKDAGLVHTCGLHVSVLAKLPQCPGL
jgi:hypothetical protein